jgi:hypothetical protein
MLRSVKHICVVNHLELHGLSPDLTDGFFQRHLGCETDVTGMHQRTRFIFRVG